jgi:glycosyltransferase involved in cell wall biosynthesis
VSALSVAPGEKIRALYRRATRYLLVIVAPLVGLILAFADDLLRIWIGAEFAQHSAPVAKWLALGVLINVVAQVPFTVLQGIGKAGVAARLQLAQLPLYALALWYLTVTLGVQGAAIAWAARAAVDFLLLTFAADRVMPAASAAHDSLPLHQGAIVAVALAGFWLIGTAFASEPILKFATFGVVLTLFVCWEWTFVLDAADRGRLISVARKARQSPGHADAPIAWPARQIISDTPLVSIVIPAYNRQDFVGDAIQSVLEQTFQDFELIVIDDGSTDSTASIVKAFNSDRIKYVYQPNGGRSSARNHALRLARGSYIAFLDSDDLYLPDKIARQVAFLDQHQEFGMVYTSAYCIDEYGAPLKSTYEAIVSGRIYDEIAFYKPVTITLPTVMVRREVLDRAGGFDEAMKRFEDTDMWRRISRHCRIGAMREYTCKLRTHRDNVISSQDPNAIIDSIDYYLRKIFREDASLSFLTLRRGAGRLYLNYGEAFFSRPDWRHFGISLLKKATQYWPMNPRILYVLVRYVVLRDYPKRVMVRLNPKS